MKLFRLPRTGPLFALALTYGLCFSATFAHAQVGGVPQQSPDVAIRSLQATAVSRDWLEVSQFALLTLALCVMVVQLWLLRRSLSATEQAAAAARTSAEVIRESVYVADSAAIHFQEMLREGDRVAVVFRNCGRSLATKAELSVNLRPRGSDEKQTRRNLVEKRTVVAPNENVQLTVHDLPWSRFFVFFKGATPLRVFGVIRYEDVFGRLHVLSFNGIWTPAEGVSWEEYDEQVLRGQARAKGTPGHDVADPEAASAATGTSE